MIIVFTSGKIFAVEADLGSGNFETDIFIWDAKTLSEKLIYSW